MPGVRDHRRLGLHSVEPSMGGVEEWLGEGRNVDVNWILTWGFNMMLHDFATKKRDVTNKDGVIFRFADIGFNQQIEIGCNMLQRYQPDWHVNTFGVLTSG